MKPSLLAVFLAAATIVAACSDDPEPKTAADAGAAGNACSQAGGACVAVSPASCPNGTIGDASKYSCGSGVGSACCLPKTSTGTACETKGGTCVAVGPTACASGKIGDATTHACTGVGAQCCLP